MARVLIADKVAGCCESVLKVAGLDVDVRPGRSEREILEDVSLYDAIVVRSATRITAPIIRAGKNLKIVARAGVGVDNIDVPAATAAGVLVVNAPMGNVRAAAEHAVAMLLACARRIPQADCDMKRGKWTKKEHAGVEVGGKTLGVIGLGKIGGLVARALSGMDMTVLASDPMLTDRRARDLGVEKAQLSDLLERSDFVTVHTPLTDQTRGLIGAAELKRMKPSARLINCARGGVVDEAALAEALRNRTIAAAALDVFVEEPLTVNPFDGLDNIVMTPHLGASTAEAETKVAEDVAGQVVAYLQRGEIQNAVNVSVTFDRELRGYAALAEIMGSFLGQVIDGSPARLKLGAYGRIAERDVSALLMSALKGLLAETTEDTVNLVNVSDIAAQRGIALATDKNVSCRDYNNLMAISVAVPGRERSIAGTLLDDKSPRILELDGLRIDVQPAPYLLAMVYPDRPGVIGKLGTALGNAGINIADMAVGRRSRGGKAFVVLSVDDAVPESVLDRIGSLIDGLEEIHLIALKHAPAVQVERSGGPA